jgi:hypothetical protein
MAPGPHPPHPSPPPGPRGCRGGQGVSPQFPGVPLPVRKCHQMSSKEHIQLGLVVRWVLSTPPGHPTAGRCGLVVPVLPLLLCTRPARARPSVGGQSPPPAPLYSSRGVLPGAGPLAGYRTPIQPVCFISARAAKSRSRLCTASWPCAGWPKLLPSPNEVTRDGVCFFFQTPSKVEARRCVPLAFKNRISNHKSPRSHSQPRRFTTYQLSDEEHPRWAYFKHSGMVCDLGVCVICFLSPLSGDLNSRVSHTQSKSKTEPRSTPLHVFDRGEYQVTTAHFFFTGFRLGRVFIVLLLSLVFQVVRSQISCFRLFEARSPCCGRVRCQGTYVGWLARPEVEFARKAVWV